MVNIPYALPEEVGVPSLCISNFINKLDTYQIPMHSILLARHGQLITEAYYSPYKQDTIHRMFSVSKSFTSIAIGLLADQDKLSLQDKIIDYFPDKLPNKVHPFIAEMTIRDMLTMQSCHSVTTYKINPETDWVQSFFHTEPTHRPGTTFNYDTSASHTLAALVERRTGMPMLDFLKTSFLEQAGFSQESYMIKDPFGISMGGSGLMAKPLDLLIFATILLSGGQFLNQQLLSKEYIQDALLNHSEPLINGPTLEERQGYGYQFWRVQHNGFACYGMGGQLAVCLPDYDLILITTADTQGIQGGTQLIFNSLYEEILPHLSDDPLPANELSLAQLQSDIHRLSITPLKGDLSSPLMHNLHQQAYLLNPNPSEFTSLSLEFRKNSTEGILTLMRDNKCLSLPFGLGHIVPSIFPIYEQKCCTSGIWLNQHTLYIKSHIIDECIGSVHFHLTFKENTLSLYMKKIEETFFNEFAGYIQGKHYLKQRLLHRK